MTQLNITLDTDKLKEGILSSNLNEMMKVCLVAILNAYMEAERDAFIQAGSYERKVSRRDYRNGYYEREYITNIGSVRLKVPRTRSGEFDTEVFERYQRMDQALVLSMMEMVINGVSTRKVTHIVEELCGDIPSSKSMVSNIMKRLDPEIQSFKERSLSHSRFDYLYVDAMYIKVREDQRIVSKAVYVAQGINEDRRREIIGFMVSGAESEASWSALFNQMKERGLSTPKLIISDAHAGLKSAIQKCFLGASWQRCIAHFVRNIIAVMPRKKGKEYRQKISHMLRVTTQEEARQLKQALEAEIGEDKAYLKALDILDKGFEDAIQYMSEKPAYHTSLRSTNNLERLNRELRRRDKVIGIYPNTASAERLMGAVLMDIHESYQTNRMRFLRESKD